MTDVKNDEDYFNLVYAKFFILWRNIAIEHNSANLLFLLKYLTKRECYNIKKTIFGIVTNEHLNEPIYYEFITAFIEL